MNVMVMGDTIWKSVMVHNALQSCSGVILSQKKTNLTEQEMEWYLQCR